MEGCLTTKFAGDAESRIRKVKKSINIRHHINQVKQLSK